MTNDQWPKKGRSLRAVSSGGVILGHWDLVINWSLVIGHWSFHPGHWSFGSVDSPNWLFERFRHNRRLMFGQLKMKRNNSMIKVFSLLAGAGLALSADITDDSDPLRQQHETVEIHGIPPPKRIKHIWKKQTKAKFQFTQRIFELAPDTFRHHYYSGSNF